MSKASTRNSRVRIFDWRDDAFDSCFDQRVGAWVCAPLMRVRFERNVSSSPARLVAGLFERERLSMLHFIKKIEAFADDLSIRIDYDCAHERAGTDLADAARGEIERE